MAESELSILSGQCLDRRIPDKQMLIEEVAAWEKNRNKHNTKADWQFTTADARTKLKRLCAAWRGSGEGDEGLSRADPASTAISQRATPEHEHGHDPAMSG